MVSIIAAVVLLGMAGVDTWKALVGWKHARDHRLINPYVLQASYTQTARVKVDEEAKKLVDITGNAGDFSDVIMTAGN